MTGMRNAPAVGWMNTRRETRHGPPTQPKARQPDRWECTEHPAHFTVIPLRWPGRLCWHHDIPGTSELFRWRDVTPAALRYLEEDQVPETGSVAYLYDLGEECPR